MATAEQLLKYSVFVYLKVAQAADKYMYANSTLSSMTAHSPAW